MAGDEHVRRLRLRDTAVEPFAALAAGHRDQLAEEVADLGHVLGTAAQLELTG